MRNAFLLFVCSFFMLFSVGARAQSNVDGMTLLGMAEFTELRRPYYIGALYTDTPSSNADLILNSNGRRRMEIRVVHPRWSMRRFSNQWTMSLFINNEQDDLLKFDDSLIQFNSLLNRPFVTGDQIIVDSYDDGSAKVFVNGAEALSVSTPGFLELLVSKWIGPKPPSTEFKQAILNNSSDIDMESRFVALEPDSARIAQIKEWFAGGVAGVRLDDSKDSETEDVVEEVAEVAVVEAAPEPVAEPEEVVQEVAAVVEEAAPAVEPAPPEPVVEEEPEIDPAIYAKQQELLGFLYQNSVVKRILRNVKYPRRALDRDQQDRIRVTVDVDRKGNVDNIRFDKESKFALLNKAALSAIDKTGKMPPVPAGLDGETIAVTIPFNFILQ